MKPFPVFIGYDSREPLAYHVFSHSIMTRASIPVAITPLIQPLLRQQHLYTRERGMTESTEFSMTRFLVPALCGYEGLALFADCDMLMRADIADLPVSGVERWNGGRCEKPLRLADLLEFKTAYDLRESPAVWCCQHDYKPHCGTKMDGQVQTSYPRKNWSSFMLINAERWKPITPDVVNHASGKDLHRFSSFEDDDIGSIPLEWNWLVGEYDTNAAAKNLHYTLGGPWMCESDMDEEWYAEYFAASGSRDVRV